jgi:N-acetylglutamate synthase-like GNAT family acetyltransferase
MRFKPVTSDDLDQIRRLQPEGWKDILPDFKFYIESNYCFPIKTIVHNKIVGTGTAIVFENSCWLAHIIVDIEFRNKGIGYQIVKELLKIQNKKPIQSFSLLATELGQPVYLKAGFQVITEYTTLQRQNSREIKVVLENMLPFREEFRPAIYKLDKKISGENRERLISDKLINAIIYLKDMQVVGYYLPEFKEGPIFADNSDAGLALMKLKYSKIDKAVLPSNNVNGIFFLSQNGFELQDMKATRMILGKKINWEPDKIYSRIA